MKEEIKKFAFKKGSLGVDLNSIEEKLLDLLPKKDCEYVTCHVGFDPTAEYKINHDFKITIVIDRK